MTCERCGNLIPAERLEANPNATMCVPCLVAEGDVPTKVGHMVYNHKTAGEIEIVSQATLDNINRLDPRGYKRGTTGRDEIDTEKDE